MMRATRTIGRIARRGALILACAIAAGAVAGCDGVLDVEDNPGTIGAESLKGAGAFDARYYGAQGDFVAAYDLAVLLGGLFADELQWGGSFIARAEIDRRDVRTSNDVVGTELYAGLQTAAKTSKDMQRDILDGVFESEIDDPANSAELARMSFFSGYARLFLGDLFCTVAFDGTGPELTSTEVYGLAVEDFTRVVEAEDVEPAILNAALVGRARARLQLGDDDGALADAERVPTGFEYVLEYSTNSARQENDIHNFTWGNERLTIEAPFRALTIDDTDAPDPRVESIDQEGTTFNGNVALWTPGKYDARASPIRLASWEEARYIIAEIEGGAVARDIINELRAARGIEEVYDPGETATDDEIRVKLFDERARALFLEGQRMGDMRRYLDRYGLDVFPTGSLSGDQTCMPLPDVERDNNPEI
ncbi:MAG: RagB/SusD family nutrient uptake outer membrane protein [Gemmatimonadota bacterium]